MFTRSETSLGVVVGLAVLTPEGVQIVECSGVPDTYAAGDYVKVVRGRAMRAENLGMRQDDSFFATARTLSKLLLAARQAIKRLPLLSLSQTRDDEPAPVQEESRV